MVHYFSDHSIRGGMDPGFGVNVSWDIPLLEGYERTFLSRDADLLRPSSVSICDPERVLRSGGYDSVMVHGYMHRFERQVVVAAKKLGFRTLARGEFTDRPNMTDGGTGGKRNYLKTLVREAYLKWFYRKLDAFLLVGTEARLHLTRMGIDNERMFWSPYSVDTDLIERQQEAYNRAESRRTLQIASGQVAVLFSGKLVPRKDPFTLIEAIEKLPGRQNVVLIVIGDGVLRHQVEAAGRKVLGSRLIMPGFVNQSSLGRYYMAADLFVLPSVFETWGLVVNEAMQYGLPAIVSCNVGCAADLVIEGRTGFIFDAGNSSTLAECLRRYFEAPDLASRMGVAAREHIGQFTTEASARGILEALGMKEKSAMPTQDGNVDRPGGPIS